MKQYKKYRKITFVCLLLLFTMLFAGCGNEKLVNKKDSSMQYAKETKDSTEKVTQSTDSYQNDASTEEKEQTKSSKGKKKNSSEKAKNEKEDDVEKNEEKSPQNKLASKKSNTKTSSNQTSDKKRKTNSTKKNTNSSTSSTSASSDKNTSASSTAASSTTAANPTGDRYVEISDGSGTTEDQYKTDPVPAGQQLPVQPEDITVDSSKQATCSLLVECSTILKNMDDLTKGKESLVPKNGIIYKKDKVTFSEGESVADILIREMKNNKIHLEYSFTPGFNSDYIEGIGNLYEFDCGNLSGWTYSVNGWFPNYGCSRYVVKSGDKIEWRYTCDLGRDVGADISGE